MVVVVVVVVVLLDDDTNERANSRKRLSKAAPRRCQDITPSSHEYHDGNDGGRPVTRMATNGHCKRGISGG